MKLLSTLIAAVFAVVSYTAIAADAPKADVKPTMAATPAAKAEAKKEEAKPSDQAKPAKKHKKHKTKKAVDAAK